MRLETALDLYAGGPGSGCNPEKGVCGRKPGKGDKSTRAKSTYVPMTKATHKEAMASQSKLAKTIKGQEISDNKPFDVVWKKTGIEVKTLVSQKNDKITMHPSSLAKKMKEARASGLKQVFTVAFDKRPGKNGIYVREGLGSFRLGTMTKVKDMNELKAIITRGK